ncbi:MAG TPA: hypothetical protein VNO32_08815, partial [Candidatus Acidoferrum sp.]|nr:hypothetical protein [Candidatus Acidoferrum sp.]
MASNKIHSSRRTFLLSAAPAVACGFHALALPKAARAHNSPSSKSQSASSQILSSEYWAKRGDVSLYLFRKRTGPHGGQTKLPVLFLAHGSSVSSRPSFDLSVPGHGEYSLMNVFAEYGFDVWTMDFDGYGKSSKTNG